ncbi:MAG: bifunctional adenosylcobinamide kinase/adenosylcobinamide-phosphate guanylyltransferase [Pseudanabaenaceae cyanobacterium bins.39]|nr:bifunctional adenosylcobinamide kinase/adenosylcobinamide-phosphate guanylyltransferase [Pseudanabaenaceae cyanobacterium bins.39]
MLTLVTGATRSGKSEWAEHLAMRSVQQNACKVIYIATAQRYAADHEWDARILKHRDRRPDSWQTLEVPIDLTGTIIDLFQSSLNSEGYPEKDSHHEPTHILVDSLGTWVANLLEVDDPDWLKQEQELLQSLESIISRNNFKLTFVSEEVGWGIVPAYASGRKFRDRLGAISRKIGAIANHVYLVTGGHALDLTQFGEKLPQP